MLAQVTVAIDNRILYTSHLSTQVKSRQWMAWFWDSKNVPVTSEWEETRTLKEVWVTAVNALK